MLSLSHIKFCAEECQRQQSGEMSVYHMCVALDILTTNRYWLSHEGIQKLGALVEPRKNSEGYRKTPVMIGDQVLPADLIYRSMHNWIQLVNETMSNVIAVTAYEEFEKIHPFVDGNGRVGALLFNLLNDTLGSPVAPPDVFAKEKVK